MFKKGSPQDYHHYHITITTTLQAAIIRDPLGEAKYEIMVEHDGTKLSGSSVAQKVPGKDAILLGGVYADNLLHCQAPKLKSKQ
eukprot:gene14251-biopygen3883